MELVPRAAGSAPGVTQARDCRRQDGRARRTWRGPSLRPRQARLHGATGARTSDREAGGLRPGLLRDCLSPESVSRVLRGRVCQPSALRRVDVLTHVIRWAQVLTALEHVFGSAAALETSERILQKMLRERGILFGDGLLPTYAYAF